MLVSVNDVLLYTSQVLIMEKMGEGICAASNGKLRKGLRALQNPNQLYSHEW